MSKFATTFQQVNRPNQLGELIPGKMMSNNFMIAIALMAIAAGASADVHYESCGSQEFTRSVKGVRVGHCGDEAVACKLQSGEQFGIAFSYEQADGIQRPVVRVEFDDGNVLEKRVGGDTMLTYSNGVGSPLSLLMKAQMPTFLAGKSLNMKVTVRELGTDAGSADACIEVPVLISE